MSNTASDSLLTVFILAISSITVRLLGFDYYAGVGAAIGAGCSVLWTLPKDEVNKWKIIAFAVVSTLVGGIAGTVLASFLPAPPQNVVRPVLMLCTLVCAFGAQKFLTAITDGGASAARAAAERLGGAAK